MEKLQVSHFAFSKFLYRKVTQTKRPLRNIREISFGDLGRYRRNKVCSLEKNLSFFQQISNLRLYRKFNRAFYRIIPNWRIRIRRAEIRIGWSYIVGDTSRDNFSFSKFFLLLTINRIGIFLHYETAEKDGV